MTPKKNVMLYEKVIAISLYQSDYYVAKFLIFSKPILITVIFARSGLKNSFKSVTFSHGLLFS